MREPIPAGRVSRIKSRRTAQVGMAGGLIGIVLLAVAGCSGSDNATAASAAPDAQRSSAAAATSANENFSVQGFAVDAAAADNSEETVASQEASPSKQGSPSKAEQPGAGEQNGLLATDFDDRDVIRTANVQVEITLDPAITKETPEKEREKAMRNATATAANLARGAATGAGGYISDSEQLDNVYTITARVPKEGYDTFISAMSGFGDVVSSSETSQDVTGQVADTASRIKTMRASVDRVRTLLADAKDVSTVVKIEAQLTARESDLDSLLAQQAKMANQVAYSTIAVSFKAVLTPVAKAEEVVVAAPAPEPNGFVKGLRGGWDAFVGFVTGVAAVLGAVLPFLPVIAIVIALIWLGVRWSRSRSNGRDGSSSGLPGILPRSAPSETPEPV